MCRYLKDNNLCNFASMSSPAPSHKSCETHTSTPFCTLDMKQHVYSNNVNEQGKWKTEKLPIKSIRLRSVVLQGDISKDLKEIKTLAKKQEIWKEIRRASEVMIVDGEQYTFLITCTDATNNISSWIPQFWHQQGREQRWRFPSLCISQSAPAHISIQDTSAGT